MSFWDYLTTATNGQLGPAAGLVISLSLFIMAGGILLVILPGMLGTSSRLRWIRGRKEAGPKEEALREELRVKVGVGIAVWNGTLILALLLRLIGTPGLETRWLPTLVIVVLPFLVGYVVVYRLFFYPRYLEICRRIDGRKSYEPTKKGSSKKAKAEVPQKPKIHLMPGKAMVGLAVIPVIYYLATTFISIPPGGTPSSHDHLWHQLGTLLNIPLGYLIGLAISLGDDLRPLLPFLQMRKDESSSVRR